MNFSNYNHLVPEDIKPYSSYQKTLDDKAFRGHLFKIVAIPVIIIFFTLLFSHFETQYRDQLNSQVENYDSILFNIVLLQKNISDMETSERGFIISGNEYFLQPITKSLKTINKIEDDLFNSIGANPKLNKRLRITFNLYKDWKAHSNQVIQMRKTSKEEVSEKMAIEGSPKISLLRESVEIFRSAITRGRALTEIKIEKTKKLTFYLEIVILLLLMFFLAYLMTKQLKALTSSYRTLIKENYQNIDAINRASKDKDLFLANMSHEIRTPLGAIIGFANLATQAQDLDSETRNHLNFIKRNSEHLHNLIDDLFDLSKVSADKVAIFKEEIDLINFREDLQGLYSNQVQDKNIILNIIIQDDIPRYITADPVRLKQIVTNLVGNAIKFSPRESQIDVIFTFKDEYFTVDVIDQGIGIPEDMQDSIFEAFKQVDPNHTRQFGGAGLGLSIAKKLANLMDGDVFLVDTKKNIGSHFRLSLKITDYKDSTFNQESVDRMTTDRDQSHKPDETTFDLSGCKILLAEDSKENQILFKIFIESSGAKVTIVENGAEAVRKALREEFDLILMDIQMPNLDGYEAVKILRSSQYPKKIIALTAHTLKGEKEKCIQAGFDGYLSKPVSQNKLLKTIQQFIR